MIEKLTKEQIEAVRDYVTLGRKPSDGAGMLAKFRAAKSVLDDAGLTKKADAISHGYNLVDALCDLAIIGLAVQPRPISEFDETTPPTEWDLTWWLGEWRPTVFSEEGEYCLFGSDITISPTHFIASTALPKVKS